jgi:phospholipid/cholesterol/gamma-HCH transport system ATP-binding protein
MSAAREKDCDVAIRITGLTNSFGDQIVHEDLSLDVRQGEILGVVGGSGTGKSVLMRSIIGLQTPDAGKIEVLGDSILEGEEEDVSIRSRWGVLFQGGALFSTLTVAENVMVPLAEFYPQDQHSAAPRDRAVQDCAVGPARGCGGQIPLRAFGRHEEARRSCPRAVAGP